MGHVEVGRIKVIPQQWSLYRPTHSTDYNLGGLVTLVGYDLEDQVRAGRKLDFTLYWQVEQAFPADYTVFSHLLDPDGQLWGQGDEQPIGGDYPTSAWAPGEVIRDEYEIPVGRDVPPGLYQLEVGMYVLDTGTRLPVSEKGSPVGSRILLGSVEVVQ